MPARIKLTVRGEPEQKPAKKRRRKKLKRLKLIRRCRCDAVLVGESNVCDDCWRVDSAAHDARMKERRDRLAGLENAFRDGKQDDGETDVMYGIRTRKGRVRLDPSFQLLDKEPG